MNVSPIDVATWKATVPPVKAVSTTGSLLESWLGATLEAPGILNNDMLNFINTAAAAAVAIAVAAWMT